jgi:hypothetical protein
MDGGGKVALLHNPLSLTRAASDSVLRLAVGQYGKKVDHLVDSTDVVFSSSINHPFAGPRTDTDPNAHKIADPEMVLGHGM